MKIEPVHHIPMKPEYQAPYTAAYAIEGGRLIFFSGCCTAPIYYDPVAEAENEKVWINFDFRTQAERTFEHIGQILQAQNVGYDSIVKLNVFLTDMSDQAILNDVSQQYLKREYPPARTLIEVSALALPGMSIEIDGVAVAPA